MALDEAMLETAQPDVATFRVYGWSEPTLSLGYFQSSAQALVDPRWRDVALVRRPTGGGAIWHHHERTYALVLPRAHPLAHRHVDLYQVVHEAIAQGLRSLGCPAARRGPTERDPDTPRPFLCFLDREASDLLVGGSKVVGSAQRRRSGAILQHGSLLLSRSERTPELPGVADLFRHHVSPFEDWADCLRNWIPAACGLAPHEDDWTSDERRRAEELRHTYLARGWTHRR